MESPNCPYAEFRIRTIIPMSRLCRCCWFPGVPLLVRAELGPLGYSPRTCGAQAALLRHLARWLAARHVPLSGLGSEVADEYIAARGRSFLRSGRALGPLLGYLRGLGVVPPGEAVAPEDPAGVLLARFGEWLSGERGLAPATVRSYLQQARSFAAACAGQLPALTPARVADL